MRREEEAKDHPATQPELLARILDGLEVLRLPHMRSRLEQMLADPKPDRSRLEWLWHLMELQLATRIESRVERRIREARLPARKTLEAFDFSFQPSLDRDLVLELATLRFIDEGMNVLLAGMSGTGKSHIALALALNACIANRRVRYTTSEMLLLTLNASLAANTLSKQLLPFTRPDLLVIDEVGLEQVERTVACRAGLMQKVLLPRHEKKATIVTSNIDWERWGDYLGDHLGAGALLDRLIHHSHVIVINGPSYRDHVHRQQIAQRQEKRRERKKKK